MGADLGGADLSSAFCDPKRQGTGFRGANLAGAILSKARLASADFSNAVLVSAWLDGADLSEADLREANLAQARLDGCNLSNAKLAGTTLDFARVDELTRLPPLAGYHIVSNTIVLPERWPADAGQTSAAAIGARIAAHSEQHGTEVADLCEFVDSQIAWWESRKPNADVQGEWQRHHDFLVRTRDRLQALADEIRELSAQSPPEDQEAVGNRVLHLQDSLAVWLTQFTSPIVERPRELGLLAVIAGVTAGITALTGVPALAALGLTTAAIGGLHLAKAAKTAGDKPDKD